MPARRGDEVVELLLLLKQQDQIIKGELLDSLKVGLVDRADACGRASVPLNQPPTALGLGPVPKTIPPTAGVAPVEHSGQLRAERIAIAVTLGRPRRSRRAPECLRLRLVGVKRQSVVSLLTTDCGGANEG